MDKGWPAASQTGKDALMANTMLLKGDVEVYVREKLAVEFGLPFSSMRLTVKGGGDHEFDAVSEDGSIVAGIKTSSGRTSGGRFPSGKNKDALAEVYFLTQVEAQERLLVLTNPEFLDLFMRRNRGKIDPAVEVRLIELPVALKKAVDQIRQAASDEMSRG